MRIVRDDIDQLFPVSAGNVLLDTCPSDRWTSLSSGGVVRKFGEKVVWVDSDDFGEAGGELLFVIQESEWKRRFGSLLSRSVLNNLVSCMSENSMLIITGHELFNELNEGVINRFFLSDFPPDELTHERVIHRTFFNRLEESNLNLYQVLDGDIYETMIGGRYVWISDLSDFPTFHLHLSETKCIWGEILDKEAVSGLSRIYSSSKYSSVVSLRSSCFVSRRSVQSVKSIICALSTMELTADFMQLIIKEEGEVISSYPRSLSEGEFHATMLSRGCSRV